MITIKRWLIYKILREIKNCLAGCLFLIGWQINATVLAVEDLVRDKKLGIETCDRVSAEDNSRYKDMIPYVPTPYRILRKVIGCLKLGTGDIFVDIGCGKGRVVFEASLNNPAKVVGIDMSESLLKAARDNLKAFKMHHARIEFINSDAASYDMSEGTVFFMYHPFGFNTTEAVLGNIRRSLDGNPRKIRIAIYNAAYRDLFEKQRWLEIEKVMDKGETIIWHNRSQEP